MKKEIIISSLALLLITTPAFAKQNNSNDNAPKNNQNNNPSQNHRRDSESQVQAIIDSITPTFIPTVDPSVSPSPEISPAITNTHKPSKEEKDEEQGEEESAEVNSDDPACSPEEEYKNHGEYVSCVARTHPGGKEVSEAAKSDIGKKPTLTPITSPVTSALPTIHGGFNPFKSISENLNRFFGFLLRLV